MPGPMLGTVNKANKALGPMDIYHLTSQMWYSHASGVL